MISASTPEALLINEATLQAASEGKIFHFCFSLQPCKQAFMPKT
jgi:hypothetical protein